MDKKKFVEYNTQTYRMNSKMIDWFIKFHQEELEEFRGHIRMQLQIVGIGLTTFLMYVRINISLMY